MPVARRVLAAFICEVTSRDREEWGLFAMSTEVRKYTGWVLGAYFLRNKSPQSAIILDIK